MQGLALAISWLARIATRERSEDLFWAAHPWMTWVIALFLLWVTLSAIWAEQPGDTLTAVQRYALNAALFLVVFTAIQSRQQVRALIGALIVGAVIAGLYGIAVQPSAAGAAAGLTSASGLNRLAGTIGDPNQLASVLVVGFTLSIALAAGSRRSSAIRLASAAAATDRVGRHLLHRLPGWPVRARGGDGGDRPRRPGAAPRRPPCWRCSSR